MTTTAATITPITPINPITATTLPATDAHAVVSLSDDERQRCEIWTRVMGYHRPVASFNTGKKGEFAERRHFEEARAGIASAAPCTAP